MLIVNKCSESYDSWKLNCVNGGKSISRRFRRWGNQEEKFIKFIMGAEVNWTIHFFWTVHKLMKNCCSVDLMWDRYMDVCPHVVDWEENQIWQRFVGKIFTKRGFYFSFVHLVSYRLRVKVPRNGFHCPKIYQKRSELKGSTAHIVSANIVPILVIFVGVPSILRPKCTFLSVLP